MAFLRQQGPPAIVQRQYQIFDYLKAGSNSDFKQISGETLKNDLVSVNFMTVQNEKVTEYNCLRCGHTFGGTQQRALCHLAGRSAPGMKLPGVRSCSYKLLDLVQHWMREDVHLRNETKRRKERRPTSSCRKKYP